MSERAWQQEQSRQKTWRNAVESFSEGEIEHRRYGEYAENRGHLDQPAAGEQRRERQQGQQRDREIRGVYHAACALSGLTSGASTSRT